jgi:hypothetical protein
MPRAPIIFGSLFLLRKPCLFCEGAPPRILQKRVGVCEHHLGRRESHDCAHQRVGPVRRDGARRELGEHDAHECFWGWNEERRAADFRHSRSLRRKRPVSRKGEM